MSIDPMAAAIDWLDAYRAGDIETILGMYAEDAVIVQVSSHTCGRSN